MTLTDKLGNPLKEESFYTDKYNLFYLTREEGDYQIHTALNSFQG